MSKPMTIKQIKEIESRVRGGSEPLAEDVFALLAEVARLKRLAKPNRAPTTRTRSSYTPGSNYEAMRIADDNGMSYGEKIYSKNKVDGDGYSRNDPSRERY